MSKSIEHIREKAEALANLAERDGHPFLAYLLRMAAEEADSGNAIKPQPAAEIGLSGDRG